VALVVTAEELALLPTVADEQEQVPVARLNVDDLDLDLRAAAAEVDREDLALGIRPHVDARPASPRALPERDPGAHFGEPTLEDLVHEASSLAAEPPWGRAVGRSRSPSISCTEIDAERLFVGICHGGTASRALANRCFPSLSPTLRPWIAGPQLRNCGSVVLRGGALEPGARGSLRKPQAKAADVYPLPYSCARRRGPFSLRRGLMSFQSLFKLSITS
jgi:hypothetical protein